MTNKGKLTIFLLILKAFSLSCTGPDDVKTPPLAQEGVIDIRGWDFTADGVLPVNGEWEFYYGELLVENRQYPEREIAIGCTLSLDQVDDENGVSAEPLSDRFCNGYQLRSEIAGNKFHSETRSYIIPGQQLAHIKNADGTSLSNINTAVYRLRIKARLTTLISVATNEFYTASRIWLRENGRFRLIATSGHPSINEATTRPVTHPLYGTINPETEEIIIEVANFHNVRTFAPIIRLNSTAQGKMENWKSSVQDALVIGFLLMAGLYHLILFSLRRELLSALYLGIFCLLIAARVFSISGFVNILDPANQLYTLTQKMEYAAMPLGVIAICGYIYHLFDKIAWRYWFYIHIATGIILTIFIMTTRGIIFTNYLGTIQLGLVHAIIWVLAVVIRHNVSRSQSSVLLRSRARAILFFMLFFVLCIIYDILVAQNILRGAFIVQYGLVFFLFGQSFILARENAYTWRRSETLYTHLQKKVTENSELVKNNEELEIHSNKLTEEVDLLLKEFHDLQEKMEQLNKERVAIQAELSTATKQLIQAEKMSSVGALVAGIAHDIGNPVNYISAARSNLHRDINELENFLLEMTGDDPEAAAVAENFRQRFAALKSNLGDVELGVRRITEINQSMRNISRTDTEEKAAVDLRELIDEAVVILGSKLKEFKVEKEIGALQPAKVHRSHIGQVFMNLLSNAADALKEYKGKAPAGFSGKVLIQAGPREREGRSVIRVSFEDNGPGIPPELLEKIFDSFFTTKPAGVGTGLGLAICRKIVHEHGGQLSVETSPEIGGACFVVELPV